MSDLIDLLKTRIQNMGIQILEIDEFPFCSATYQGAIIINDGSLLSHEVRCAAVLKAKRKIHRSKLGNFPK